MLIGRGAETAAIERLLDAARQGNGGALVIRGEAGVGKSALLDHARACADGMTVLHGTGVELESELAYAALHQILRTAFDRIERLPEPQAAALRAAFALSSETVDERFRVSLGVLGLLSEVAGEDPVLCLVDDAQWCDQASADALLFAARRVEGEPLALLFAARDDAASPFRAAGLSELPVRALVTERLQGAAPEVVEWLLGHANGNPLALLELPSALTPDQLRGREPLDGSLPPPTSVEQTYLERVALLEPAVRQLLLVVAAEETGDRATIARTARDLALDPEELVRAEELGLVNVETDRIRFHHPLVRSAVYRGAGFAERERVHRALAAGLPESGDADRRAWHRAAGTVGTDDEVADELERTADRAHRRSGYSAAAAALERAAGLTSETEGRARRLVLAARAAWQAGRPEHASALLHRAAPIISDPRLEMDAQHLRGVIGLRCGVLLDACRLLLGAAARAAEVDPSVALDMLFDAAEAAAYAGDYPRVAEAAERAAALPPLDGRESVPLNFLIAFASSYEGKEARDVMPLVGDLLAESDEWDDTRRLAWASTAANAVGDDVLEADLLRRALALARASGAVDEVAFVLMGFSFMEVARGRYDISAEADEGLSLALEAGLSNAASIHRSVLALIAAVSGREEECRSLAAEVNEAARSSGAGLANAIADWAVALLDLSLGRPEEAATRLALLSAARPGVGHPFIMLVSVPDLVEAAMHAGREDLAAPAGALIDGFAHPGAPSWWRALAARCRALRATGGEAERHFAEALRLHGQSDRPFDLARTELAFGEFLRRERRRVEAREQLRSALATLERLGAATWAERTRTELRASGETARKRDPSTLADLTPRELQIARLVGEGASNKDVAAQLFLSTRTVEYHLRKVFAKLGIASRAELIRGIAESPSLSVAH